MTEWHTYIQACAYILKLKCCCNASLARLMHNCSNEFLTKISNPKMSRMPIIPLVGSEVVFTSLLMVLTILGLTTNYVYVYVNVNM